MRAFPTRTPGRVQGIGPDTAYVVRELGLSRRTRRLGEFTLPSDGLGAPEIIYLREQGVSDRVITAMLKQHSKAPVAPAPAAPAPVTTIWAAPAQSSTTFAAAAPVYTQPTTVYVAPPATTYVDYYPSYRYCYPYYSPVSLSFGFGFGGYYGGYYGGYHGATTEATTVAVVLAGVDFTAEAATIEVRAGKPESVSNLAKVRNKRARLDRFRERNRYRNSTFGEPHRL